MVKIPETVGAFFLIAILLVAGYIIPITLVFGNAEISNPEIISQINLFQGLLLVGLLGIFLLYYTRKIWKVDDKYGDGFGFFHIGKFPANSFFKKYSGLQLTLISLVFLFVIFLLINVGNFQGLTGLKTLPQQFSKTESLVFSTLLIPIAEEAMTIFVAGILVLALILIAVKTNMNRQAFLAYLLGVIPILMGVIGRIWHLSAYPGSDVNGFVIFMFWTIKTFIGLFTGFGLIQIILHQINNFAVDFVRLYSSSQAFTVTLVGLIAVVVVYISIYGFTLKGVKNE